MATTIRRVGPRVGKSVMSTISPPPLHDLHVMLTDEVISVILADGFFDQFADILELDDIVDVYAADDSLSLRVTSVSQLNQRVTITFHANNLSPPTAPPTSNTFSALMLADNQTIASYSSSFSPPPLRHYSAIDGSTPTLSTDGILGHANGIIDLVDYTLKSLTIWTYDGTVWTRRAPEVDAGNGGFAIQANATLAPVRITDFDITSITAGSAICSFSATTVIDNLPLQYDIINIFSGLTLAPNVTPGTAVSIPSLTQDTSYAFAVQVYPVNQTNRVSYSNQKTRSTLTLGAVNVTFTDPVDTLDAVLATISVVDVTGSTIDQWFISSNPAEPSPSDLQWASLPVVGVTTQTLPSTGSFTYYIWGRDSSIPSAFSVPTSTVITATVTAGANVFSYEKTSQAFSEENAPTAKIRVLRTVTTGAATVGIGATVGINTPSAQIGINFHPPTTSEVSFANGESFKDFDLPLLYANLGHVNGIRNEVFLRLDMLNPSTGSISAGAGTSDVTIFGTVGYRANGALDINAPPTDLPIISPITLSNATVEEFKLQNISGSGTALRAVTITNTAQNKTIRDCIIGDCQGSAIWVNEGFKEFNLINCVIEKYNLGLQASGGINDNGALVAGSPSGQPVTGGPDTNIFIGGNRAKADGRGFVFVWEASSDNIQVVWNHFTNTFRQNNPTILFGSKDGHLCQIYDAIGGKNHLIMGNVGYTPSEGQSFDMINIGGRQMAQEADRSYCLDNFIHTSTRFDGTGSETGIIIGDGAVGWGYWTTNFNTCIETANGGLIIGGGEYHFGQYNDLYMPLDSTNLHENGNGLAIFRVLQSPPGTLLSPTVTGNSILWYKLNLTKANVYYPSVGADKISPNVGATTETPPIDLNTQNDMELIWGNGAGDNTVKGRKAVLNNPAFGDGIHVSFSDFDCVAGDLLLEWNVTSSELSITEFGDSVGQATAISTVATGEWSARHELKSASGRGIRVLVFPDNLPGIDTAYIVKVTNFKKIEIAVQPFNGTSGLPVGAVAGEFDGKWQGVERATVGTGTAPAVPSDVTVAVSSPTALSISSTSYPIAGAGSYRVYRDGTLVASPVTLPYIDTGLTTGINYSYQLASASTDNPPIVSAKSPATANTPIDSSAIIVGGEFDVDAVDNAAFLLAYPDWVLNSVNVSVSGGKLTVANSTTSSGWVRYTKNAVIANATAYTAELLFGFIPSLSAGMVIDFDSANPPGNGWQVGDLISNQSPAEDTPYTKLTNLSTSTDLQVTLWVNSGTAGLGWELSYVRLV